MKINIKGIYYLEMGNEEQKIYDNFKLITCILINSECLCVGRNLFLSKKR